MKSELTPLQTAWLWWQKELSAAHLLRALIIIHALRVYACIHYLRDFSTDVARERAKNVSSKCTYITISSTLCINFHSLFMLFLENYIHSLHCVVHSRYLLFPNFRWQMIYHCRRRGKQNAIKCTIFSLFILPLDIFCLTDCIRTTMSRSFQCCQFCSKF